MGWRSENQSGTGKPLVSCDAAVGESRGVLVTTQTREETRGRSYTSALELSPFLTRLFPSISGPLYSLVIVEGAQNLKKGMK